MFLSRVSFTAKGLTLLLALSFVPGVLAAPVANTNTGSKTATKAPTTVKTNARVNRRRHMARRSGSRKSAALKALVPSLDNRPTSSVTSKTVPDSEVRDLLAYGARKHKEGSLTEAEDCFRRVLSRDPQNVDAFFNLGALAEGRGDLIVALGHYRAAHALNANDKQIADAVHSMEKALKDGGSGADTRVTRSGFSLNPPVPQNLSLPVGGTIASPVNFGAAGAGNNFSAFPSRPQGQNLFTPSGYSASGTTPVLLPTADPAPVSQDGQFFQLTGTQNAAMPPAIGVQSQQSQVPPSLTVGGASQPVTPAGPSRGRAAARAAANMALSIGTSYALRGTGLHCPICRIVRLRF